MRASLMLGLALLAACAPFVSEPTAQRQAMMGMPCHQMPDGAWMGNCEGTAPASRLPGEEVQLAQVAKPPQILDVGDGETVDISATVVEKEIGGVPLKMYAYNGMIPGVVIRARQGSSLTVRFTNNIDQETTIHWHGLRHDNKDDGVPDVTQKPVQPGETYTYTLRFPDSGVFWYHPHIREDLQQDAGLAGNILVLPASGQRPLVSREELLVLDDILLGKEGLVPYGAEHANHAIMGRFGNVLLVNGEERYDLEVSRGDVVRFYVTNVANARPFNLSFGGARMKLIGSDLSNYEREQFAESIIVAPAERYVVDVLFDDVGSYELRNVNPQREYVLGKVRVREGEGDGEIMERFEELRTDIGTTEDVDRFRPYFDKATDYELELDVDMMGMMMRMEHTDADGGVEWEDTMHMMNAMHDASMLRWVIRGSRTRQENDDLMLSAKVGDVVKIKIKNLEEGMHPMQHPIHLHGQRFLVVSRDGVLAENLVWKDTVLVPMGSEVEILVDVTNPGEWMLHCHIAEHLEAGMMAHFSVEK